MNVHAAKPAGTAPMSEPEWQTRVDLAACYRLVDHFGMTDLHLNHISARVPGNDEHFLINPFGMLYEEITASSLIKIDLAGNIVANANPEYSINLPGYVIHGAIHGARHDAMCVLHTHTNAGMAISSLKCGLLPITQTAMRWPRIAYHDYEGVVVDLDEQSRLVKNLGDCGVMILRNHGLLSIGRTIGEAFNQLPDQLRRPVEVFALMQIATNIPGMWNPDSDDFEFVEAIRPDGSRREMPIPRMTPAPGQLRPQRQEHS